MWPLYLAKNARLPGAEVAEFANRRGGPCRLKRQVYDLLHYILLEP